MSDQRVDQDAKRQSVRLDRSDSNLDAALGFVIDRIAEQGEVSGEPLGVEQCPLLNYPPSRTPQTWDPEFFVLVPRNVNLERVCALAKVAHRHDRQMNPALLDWEFAFAVFAFTGAPYGGSSAIGGGETQETEMGPAFTYCHCVDAPSGCRLDWMEHK